MAHFAELDTNNVVLQVIVVDNNVLEDESGVEHEQKGVDFCKGLFGQDTIWKQTSYNNSFRVRYAGIGYSFNESLDAFITPKPYPSWSLDPNIADWVAPVPKPALTPDEEAAGMVYIWNEDNQEWVLIQGP
jgi:hypothetical protein